MDYSSVADLLTDSSRANVDLATEFVGNDENRFEETLQLAVNSGYPLNMRAARVLEFSALKNPQFALKRIEFIVKTSATNSNDGVKRAFMKITERFLPNKIDEDLLGLVINNCFDKLNGIETVSVKYYSINCLIKILKREPDLKHELLESLYYQIGRNTTAFDRYMKKKIKEIEKLSHVNNKA